MLLRKCNGKCIDSGELTDKDVLEIFNYSPKDNEDFNVMNNNDFECMAGQSLNDVNPPLVHSDCIVSAEIDEERECSKFKKVN